MLDFIGTGSAFNTKLGNNGAFIKRGKELFLIDCGSNTFDRLIKNNVLDGVENIAVLLTHTHPDHVGSLGDLIFYSYYAMGEMMKRNLTVFSHHSLQISKLLSLMGVDKDVYDLFEFASGAGYRKGDLEVNFKTVPTYHVIELESFGFIIEHENRTCYYSGDSKDISPQILDKLHNGEFDFFYQDTCKADYKGNVHLSLRELDELIEQDYRYMVYCMHLDGGFVNKEAEDLGFKVAKSIAKGNVIVGDEFPFTPIVWEDE